MNSKTLDDSSTLTLTLEEAFRGGIFNLRAGERTLFVNIPKGITEGTELVLRVQSENGGDLYLTIHIEPDSFYELNGYDLIRELTVETPAGEILIVKMPAGIKDGQMLRLGGKGMPKRDGTNGDLFLRVIIAEES